MKATERKALKQRITNLAKEQFGPLLKGVRFSGPFEEEDLDADLILRERIDINQIGEKFGNIYEPLRKEGYNVLIGFKFDGKSARNRKKQHS
jgi:hypothetical protein